MKSPRAAAVARSIGLACLVLAATPVPAAPASPERLLIPSASWHGRAIQEPHRHDVVRTRITSVPRRWSAGAVSFGTGFHRTGGSLRVREVQHRLRRLGYRPGPIDGLFGPRTRAAVAWFQVKHGLRVDGRATLATVRHLRARTGAGFGRQRAAGERLIVGRPGPTSWQAWASAIRASAADGSGAPSSWWIAGLVFLLAALAGAALAGRRRRVASAPTDEHRPLDRAMLAGGPSIRRGRRRRRVLAYVLIPAEASEDASYREHTAAIEAECAEQGMALTGLLSDVEDVRLDWQRPGLATAVERLVSGEADLLMVTLLADPSESEARLQRLVKVTEDEIAIARWQRTPIGGPGRREASRG